MGPGSWFRKRPRPRAGPWLRVETLRPGSDSGYFAFPLHPAARGPA
jgi:hypothetical protein